MKASLCFIFHSNTFKFVLHARSYMVLGLNESKVETNYAMRPQYVEVCDRLNTNDFMF